MIELERCPLCKNKNFSFYVSGGDYLTKRKGLWNYYKCSDCSYVFLNPTPTGSELQDLYNSENEKLHYHHLAIPRRDTSALGKIKFYLKKAALVHFLKNDFGVDYSFITRIISFPLKRRLKTHLFPVFMKKDCAILEIGCGNGERIGILKQFGFNNISANEFNVDLANSISKHFDMQVWTEDIREISDLPKFDFIVSSMVLEHIVDPQSFVERVYELLSDKGVFCFSVPNIESVEAKIFKNTFYGLQPPYHISQFSSKSLKFLLKKFKKIEFYCQPIDRDWVVSCRRKAAENSGMRFKVLDLLSLKLLRYLIVKPFIRVLSCFGKTARLTVYAYKDL